MNQLTVFFAAFFFSATAAAAPMQLPGLAPSNGFPAPYLGPIEAGSPPVLDGEEAALKELVQASWQDAKREVLALALLQGRFKAWHTSLWLDLGLYYYRHGYFSRSLDAFERAWKAGAKDPKVAHLADRAGTEYARMLSRVGRLKELKALLKALAKRPMQGLPSKQRQDARGAIRAMEQRPEISFRCGSMAMANVLRSLEPARGFDPVLRDAASPRNGFSLAELRELSESVRFPMVPVQRQAGAAVPVPAIVHWKLGHYSAVIEEKNGLYHLIDPTFLDEHWMTLEALEDESSGYFMVPAGQEQGYGAVDAKAAGKVRGKGYVSETGPVVPPCEQITASGCGGCPDGAGGGGGGGADACEIGMPRADMDLNLTALKVVDSPLLYEPARGPRVKFTLSYHDQHESNSNYDLSGLGGRWRHSFESYHFGDYDFVPGGKAYFIYEFPLRNGGTGSLDDVTPPGGSAGGFTKLHPSGWKEVYEAVFYAAPYTIPCMGCNGGGPTYYRDFFRLVRLEDPQGNALTFGYGTGKLSTVTDATGGVTTLHYEKEGFPYLITRVQDPFERYAQMTYDSSGRLQSVRDTAGMVSSFSYNETDLDLLDSMTTPYGTTTFTRLDDINGKSLVITDPVGGKRKALYRTAMAVSDAGATQMPAVGTVRAWNAAWDARNVAYWDEKAMAEGPADTNKATIYHFQHAASPFGNRLGSLIESIKRPLENRVYFSYEGQLKPANPPYNPLFDVHVAFEDGIVKRRPNRIGMVLDDTTTQYVQIDRNDQLQVTKFVDPAGRETHYEYAANGRDVLFVRNKNSEVLAAFEYNGPPHRPTKLIDAGGKQTLLTYNPFGQLESVQMPTGETTTLEYGIVSVPTGPYGDGSFLKAIVPPAPGSRVDFTPDPMGRIGSSDDDVNGILEYEYDNLNRLTKVIYPDDSYEQIVYDRLDVDTVRDRNGLVTDYTWTAVRRLQSVLDPQNRLTQLGWCECGALSSLTDPEGSITTWDYDLQGRLKTKTYHDNTKVHYVYENKKSRLKSVTDAKGQETRFTYEISDRLTYVNYLNAQVPTAPVAFVYDSVFGRLQSMADGTGPTTFDYHPIPTGSGNGLGAGRLATVNGPLENDTIGYLYDAAGRLGSVAVNGVAETMAYSQGRLDSVTNPLGTFTHAYSPTTGLLDTVTYPGGKLDLDYHTTNQDKGRLKDIQHYNPALQLLARHGYSYDPSGRITTWEQRPQTGPGHDWVLGYDNAGQLTSGQKLEGGTQTQQQLKGFTYDLAGNRTKDTTDGTDTDFIPNDLNQLTQVQPKGPIQFQGQTNQPANVQVGGQAATQDSENVFSTKMPLATSVVELDVTAETPGGQTITQRYEVKRDRSLAYDLNGNLINDGQRSYTWDAANRLVKVSVLDPTTGLPSRTSEFTYDGLDRRVRIVEKEGVTVFADRWFVWDAERIAEERDSANNTVKRFYSSGVQVVTGTQAGAYYYLTDLLGSVYSVLNSSGVVVAAYDFDLWGKRTKLSGSFDADFGFTGHFQHDPSGLVLTLYRGYSSALGRWLNRDPLEEEGGLNLYAYVMNDPISYFDPLGLKLCRRDLPGMNDAIIDDSMSPRIDDWLARNKKSGVDITFNEAYRTAKQQKDMHSNQNGRTPADVGESTHEAGYAVDVDWSKVPKKKRDAVIKNAGKAGIHWGGNFEKKDPVHFYRRPNNLAKKIADAHKQKEIGQCGK